MVRIIQNFPTSILRNCNELSIESVLIAVGAHRTQWTEINMLIKHVLHQTFPPGASGQWTTSRGCVKLIKEQSEEQILNDHRDEHFPDILFIDNRFKLNR